MSLQRYDYSAIFIIFLQEKYTFLLKKCIFLLKNILSLKKNNQYRGFLAITMRMLCHCNEH